MARMSDQVIQDIVDAVDHLRSALAFHYNAQDAVVTLSGFDDRDLSILTGIHIAGQLVNAVRSDLEVVADLLPHHPDEWDLIEAEVERLLDPSRTNGDQFVVTRRNPWLAEALAHLIIHLGRSGANIGIPGRVWAVTPVTSNVTRQGIDMVAIYEDVDGPGYYVAEVKASEKNISKHLTSACGLYREILDGSRAFDLRTHIHSLAHLVPVQHRSALRDMIWSKAPLFSPILSYGSTTSFDAAKRSRTVRTELRANRLVLKVMPLTSYHEFFDTLAESVSRAVLGFKDASHV